MKNFATLQECSPFYPLFDQGRIPIKNIIVPDTVECEGDGVQEVYWVDLEKLTHDQFQSLCQLVADQRRSDVPLQIIKAEIRERGLPLRAKIVRSVESDTPFFL